LTSVYLLRRKNLKVHCIVPIFGRCRQGRRDNIADLASVNRVSRKFLSRRPNGFLTVRGSLLSAQTDTKLPPSAFGCFWLRMQLAAEPFERCSSGTAAKVHAKWQVNQPAGYYAAALHRRQACGTQIPQAATKRDTFRDGHGSPLTANFLWLRCCGDRRIGLDTVRDAQG
jgi:hypothetical protein